MPVIKTKGDQPVELFYQDLGKGKPVIFIHGWPSNSCMWEYQLGVLPERYRCIAYDRRGFGCSEGLFTGYDYDTLASDLNDLIEGLELSDVTLVGFSMGGGEVIRYLSNYGSSKVSKIVLISSVVPYMMQAQDNPDGLPKSMFDEFDQQIRTDRPAFLSTFGKMFFGVTLVNHPVSNDLLTWAHGLTLMSSQAPTLGCLWAFASTDFREECKKVDVPALLIHGDADKTVPIGISSQKAVGLIPDAELKIYNGAPHGLFVTEKERLNKDLIGFIG